MGVGTKKTLCGVEKNCPFAPKLTQSVGNTEVDERENF